MIFLLWAPVAFGLALLVFDILTEYIGVELPRVRVHKEEGARDETTSISN